MSASRFISVLTKQIRGTAATIMPRDMELGLSYFFPVPSGVGGLMLYRRCHCMEDEVWRALLLSLFVLDVSCGVRSSSITVMYIACLQQTHM